MLVFPGDGKLVLVMGLLELWILILKKTKDYTSLHLLESLPSEKAHPHIREHTTTLTKTSHQPSPPALSPKSNAQPHSRNPH